MIEIREAKPSDAESISKIFGTCYGADYAYPQFYDVDLLTKMIYTDDTLLLVAEDLESHELLGTASVIYNVGAYSDLSGEFGRLAVIPAHRNSGVGTRLMEERLNRVRQRLQIGLIDARVIHPFTQKISEKQGFSAVGFMPQKILISYRESIVLMVQYFGDALQLRCNHPRIIPEVYALAHAAMENCGIVCDVIIDEDSASYPFDSEYEIEELSTEGYSALLRIQRGRVRNREIFGPMRLHYGVFKLLARQSTYLLAKRQGQIVGAVGFTHDEVEKAAKIFELISMDDHVIRHLLSEVERKCREELAVEFIDVDVSAYSPRMQRTLLELDFVPAAYIPASVFHEVERLDAVKMIRLLVPLDLKEIHLSEKSRPIAETVLRSLEAHKVAPAVVNILKRMSLFEGLNVEQVKRLAGVCTFETFDASTAIYRQADPADKMFVILDGEVAIAVEGAGTEIGSVSVGECLGEVALLTSGSHSASATTRGALKAAVLSREVLAALVRRRPDIGVQIYNNLAIGLAEKLKRSDSTIVSRTPPS